MTRMTPKIYWIYMDSDPRQPDKRAVAGAAMPAHSAAACEGRVEQGENAGTTELVLLEPGRGAPEARGGATLAAQPSHAHPFDQSKSSSDRGWQALGAR